MGVTNSKRLSFLFSVFLSKGFLHYFILLGGIPRYLHVNEELHKRS